MHISIILKSTVTLVFLAQLCYAQAIGSFVPDYVSLQYAGSTGWLSVGTGYNFFNEHLRGGIQYGFVPRKIGGELHILSAALLYKPWKVNLSDKISINPVDFGIKAGYQFGEKYYLNWPSRYPEGYYWWNSALRLHLVSESSVTFKLRQTSCFKSLTAFVDFNSNELYMISYVLNMKTLKLTEIIKTGVGFRLGF